MILGFLVKVATSTVATIAGDVIGGIGNSISEYSGEKCDESDSIIGKTVFGSVWLASSAVGGIGTIISAAADAIGDAVGDHVDS